MNESALSHWSLEVVPAHASRVSVVRGLVNDVFVTMIPGSRIQDLLAALRTIAEQGLVPVPHIVARELRSELELDECCEVIRRLGLRKALVLGGGAARPLGPYAESMDVLQTKAFTRMGLDLVSVAGHPEGNPADPQARQSLEKKLRFLRAAGIGAEIVTQWSFSPEKVSAYIADLRASGITEPVAVGVAGPASLGTLLKYAKTCGINASQEVLRKQGFSLGRLLVGHSPGAFVAQVVGATRFHLYPFGGLKKCARWLAEHQAGQ